MQNNPTTPARTPKPQPKLAEMIKGQVFDGFLLTRSAAQKTSSNGGKYLDMTLCDISGEVNAKMWDGLTPPPAVAEVLRVRGMMMEYNGRPQLRVDKIRPVTDNDVFDMNMLVPCAPTPASEMLDIIRDNLYFDFGLAHTSSLGNIWSLFGQTLSKGTSTSFKSSYDSNASIFEEKLATVIESYKKLD